MSSGRQWQPSSGQVGGSLGHGQSLRRLWWPLTYSECGVHVELPVHALLLRPEVTSRIRHWDHLGPVDLVRVPIGHNGRRAGAEDILQPISALAIRQGDQDAVIVLGGDDGRLVRAARSSATWRMTEG
jgi:hypothetical protein